MKKKNKKFKFTRGEYLLYFLAILSITGVFVLKIFSTAKSSNIKMDIEKINVKIDKQKSVNESLKMQVSELTSYENLDSILKDMGLSYNDESIIIINK